MSERLQKFLARAGVASRRHAEALIVEGRVKVNSEVVTTLGTKVEPGKDLVTVDGKLVEAESARAHFLFYKPPGVVTTLSDPQGRPSISDFTKPLKLRLFPVGRLDYDAEGALLLTDDGDLAYQLTHPRFQVPRTYLAKVKGNPDVPTLDRLRGGVRLEDGFAKPLTVDVFERAEKNTWLKIVVTEGRQHLVKRLCAAIGHPVVRLYRPHYAGLSLDGLRPGQVRALNKDEVKKLEAAAKGESASAEPAIRLPARRHGHGDWGQEPEDGEQGVRPPKPRFSELKRDDAAASRRGKYSASSGGAGKRDDRKSFGRGPSSNAKRSFESQASRSPDGRGRPGAHARGKPKSRR
jgi:23S rRNA pseudouridine2605 synthase